MNPRTPDDAHAQAGAMSRGVSPSDARPGEAAAAAPELDVQVRKVPESILDDAVEATFPASDPVAVVSTKALPADDGAAPERRA